MLNATLPVDNLLPVQMQCTKEQQLWRQGSSSRIDQHSDTDTNRAFFFTRQR